MKAGKQYDPAFVEEIKRAAAAAPEAEFSNAQETLDYLNGIAPLPRPDDGVE